MATAAGQLSAGLTIGHVGLGHYNDSSGSVLQQVHDGDTVSVRAIGSFSIRFLGVNAPEISFTLSGSSTFTDLGSNKWEAFFANLDDEETYGSLSPPFAAGLA